MQEMSMPIGFPARAFSVADFARFTSRESCELAVLRGELAILQLLPDELGGAAADDNQVFVPPWVAAQKRRIDQDAILPLFRAGKLSRYQAQPIYHGSSRVPVEIVLHAFDPAGYTTTLCIW